MTSRQTTTRNTSNVDNLVGGGDSPPDQIDEYMKDLLKDVQAVQRARGKESDALRALRMDNRRERLGLGADDRDVHRFPGRTCPLGTAEKDGKFKGPWYSMTEDDYMESLRRTPRGVAKGDRENFHKVYVGEKDGKDVYKPMVDESGQWCGRIRPEDLQKPSDDASPTTVNLAQVVNSLRKVADSLKYRVGETTRELEQGRSGDAGWKRQSAGRMKEFNRLVNLTNVSEAFKPSLERACNPSGINEETGKRGSNSEWNKLFGNPNSTKVPGVKPSEYERATGQYYRPWIIPTGRKEDDAKCVADDSREPLQNNEWNGAYHSLGDLMALDKKKLPKEGSMRMPYGQIYQKAALCAERGTDDCEDPELVEAPLGGMLRPKEHCKLYKSQWGGNNMCMPTSVAARRRGKERLNTDDEYSQWYAKFYPREQRLVSERGELMASPQALYGNAGSRERMVGARVTNMSNFS